MGVDMLNMLTDIATVTDPKTAAALKILQHGLSAYNEREISDAALQVANSPTGEFNTEVPDKRGLIGGLLQSIGVLGDPGMRPLTSNERMGANLGHMMFQAREDAAKEQQLRDHLGRLSLLASLGGKFGPGAVSATAPGLGEDPNLPFGMAGFSDMEMRQKNYQLKQRELGDTEELNKAKIGALNAKEDKGMTLEDVLAFVQKGNSAIESWGGPELQGKREDVVALEKEIRKLSVKKHTEGVLQPQEEEALKRLTAARDEAIVAYRDAQTKAGEGVGLGGRFGYSENINGPVRPVQLPNNPNTPSGTDMGPLPQGSLTETPGAAAPWSSAEQSLGTPQKFVLSAGQEDPQARRQRLIKKDEQKRLAGYEARLRAGGKAVGQGLGLDEQRDYEALKKKYGSNS